MCAGCALSTSLAGPPGGKAAPPPTRARSSVVGFARLEGTVGFTIGHVDKDRGFDGTTLEEILAKANKRSCGVIMLEVESGGGIVTEGVRIAELLAKVQHEGIKVIAWYGEAFSAASWIPIAAKTAVAKPSGTCGGSVVYSVGPDGKPTAIDAKLASHPIGKIKNVASQSGRPHAFVDAIFVQDAELWIGEDGSLRALKERERDRCLDNEKTVLNLVATDAQACKFAVGIASTREEAAKIAGIKDFTWIELGDVARARSNKIANQEARWKVEHQDWIERIPHLFETIDKAVEIGRDIAKRDEAGDRLEKSDTQPVDESLRQLREIGRNYFSKNKKSPPPEFDPSFYLGPDTTALLKMSAAKSRVKKDVSDICDLLAEKKVSSIDEAEQIAERLRDFLLRTLGDD